MYLKRKDVALFLRLKHRDNLHLMKRKSIHVLNDQIVVYIQGSFNIIYNKLICLKKAIQQIKILKSS